MERRDTDDFVARACDAFAADAAARPSITLRGGAAIDSYDEPPPYDAAEDEPTDEYLERYAFFALSYLDPASWRHYLPRLIEFALGHLQDSPGMVIDGLLQSLRPPDRTPARLGSLDARQEAVIVEFLERIAFADQSLPERDFAIQVMEEWWVPNALYRPREDAR